MYLIPGCKTLLTALTALAIPAILTAQTEIVLVPIKDTSLYQNTGGTIGNGSGQHIFAGRNGKGEIRRALLAFDIAEAIPTGASITEAELVLNLSKSPGGTYRVNIYAVLADWGEGASDADSQEGAGTAALTDDATWIHTFFDTATWQTAGGDFAATESASSDVAATNGAYAWSGDGLVADVQRWLDSPEQNFGWILLGDETTTTNARRFDSRENPVEESRPQLRISYSVSTAASDEEVPSTVALLGNYPNPFRGTTSIAYELSSPQIVTLFVHDLQGRIVARVVSGAESAGSHSMRFDADNLAPGLYLYRLSGQSFASSSKFVVLP